MGRAFIKRFIEERIGDTMLEIGPFMNPYIHKEVFNVFYADIRSKEEIFAYYLSHNLYPPELLYQLIVPIDYVIKDTYEKAVDGKKFSIVFSSHVIEHVGDILAHFQDLSKILIDKGFIVLAVPDKRYTFDHFREVTPFRDMIDVYMDGSKESVARFAFDTVFNAHPVNSRAEYDTGTIGFLEVALEEARFENAMKMYKRVKEEGYISSEHNWVFTYASFLGFIRDGLRAKLLPFTLYYADDVEPGANEFTAILQKDTAILQDDARRRVEIARIAALSREA